VRNSSNNIGEILEVLGRTHKSLSFL
jgi:hypothetical protein